MSRLQAHIRLRGGAATTRELHGVGATRESLRLAVRAGEIRRIRQGWYIDPDTPERVADALRVGGRATCATAAEYHQLWMRAPADSVHVAVAPNACQLRDPRDYRRRLGEAKAVVHWNDDHVGGTRLSVALPAALVELGRCLGSEAAFVAAECALARRLMPVTAWRQAVAEAPSALRVALSRAGRRSGSITESTFAFRMRALGIDSAIGMRPQVQIGEDRVDFVLGRRLVVELDSREFHEPERDYARDARLSARGYRVMRFTYRQVMFQWPTVEASLLAAIARGDAD